jgi:hypothetical protein
LRNQPIQKIQGRRPIQKPLILVCVRLNHA